ncbi:MAG: hypothetical protein ACKPH1_27315, partial [Microcystis panniformis]
VNTERSRSVNGTVGQTETDPNALGESGLWILNGDIENLSCLVEQGIYDNALGGSLAKVLQSLNSSSLMG